MTREELYERTVGLWRAIRAEVHADRPKTDRERTHLPWAEEYLAEAARYFEMALGIDWQDGIAAEDEEVLEAS